MSWSDRAFRRFALRATALAGLGLTAAGCTVSPLYGTSSAGSQLEAGAPGSDLAALRGRIGVSVADDRTTQIVRNELLFRFNGGVKPLAPVYEVRPTVLGRETIVSIEQGSGVPAASLYRIDITYQVVRLADAKVIGTGTRFATAPFDRSQQLFAASRALNDAREEAGKAAAARVELAVLSAIRKDLKR